MNIQECYEKLACTIIESAVNDYKIAVYTNNKSKQEYILKWLDNDARMLAHNETIDCIISFLKRFKG